jgi:F0F1-type ATP synthase assembly protein I
MSVQQAFWAPYKKLVRAIEEHAAKRAAAADAAAQSHLTTVATTAPAATPAAPAKIDTGTLAAIGLVLTTLMGAAGAIFASIFNLKPWWMIPLACAGLIVGISVPSVIMAALKLRRRNLGPLLDANGWAINSKAKINIPFGQSLTQVAVLPPGSSRNLVDPFAEDHKGRRWTIAIAVVMLIGLGCYLWFGKIVPYREAKAKEAAAAAAKTNNPPAAVTNAVAPAK